MVFLTPVEFAVLTRDARTEKLVSHILSVAEIDRVLKRQKLAKTDESGDAMTVDA